MRYNEYSKPKNHTGDIMCKSGCTHESQALVDDSLELVEQAICQECGAAHLPDDGVLACDHQFCSVDCAVEGGFLMVEGEWHDEDDVVVLSCGDYCLLDDAIYLESRDMWVAGGDSRAVWCEASSTYEHRNDCTHFEGDWYLDEALHEVAFGCDNCGETVHNDYYGGDGMCESCYSDNSESSNSEHILDYSVDVVQRLGFAPNPRKELTYGVELEVECEGSRADAAEAVHSAIREDAILKHDGSLNDGFEIVTRPAPLAYTKAVITKAAGAAINASCSSFNTKTCGFHIHVARESLSDLQVGKLLAFIQAGENKAALEKIAMRNCDRWAKLGSDLKVTDKPENRYTALNLENSVTIEFRIFKGNLKSETLCIWLDFVSLLARWSGVVSLQDCYKMRAFCNWLALPENKKEAKNLLSFFTSKGIV